MRDRRAASTRAGGGSGTGLDSGAASMASRYSRILATGRAAYSCPRRATAPAWLTPRPRIKRPGYASARVRAPDSIAAGSRAHMLAIPVATPSRDVAPRRMAA